MLCVVLMIEMMVGLVVVCRIDLFNFMSVIIWFEMYGYV